MSGGGRNWESMQDKFKDHDLSPDELAKQIVKLLKDDDDKSKQGLYEYELTGNETLLNVRAFSDAQKGSNI